jgi:hypothetical protein
MKGWIRKALIVAVMLVCVGTPLLMHNLQLARDPQLKILREMIPYWNRTESGGIELLAEPPNEGRWLSTKHWSPHLPMAVTIPISNKNGTQPCPG